MLVRSPMPIGLALVMVRGMGSATAQDIGEIRWATTGCPLGPMDQAEWDGMADMEASARHVRRVVRRPHGQPYLPIRLRGLEKFTEWSAQFTSRGLLLIFICRAAQ